MIVSTNYTTLVLSADKFSIDRCGNTKVCAPGNFDSTRAIEAGMQFALGERRVEGEGSRVLRALEEGSRRVLSFVWGVVIEELAIVERKGLPGWSFFSRSGTGMGICSAEVLELVVVVVVVDIEIGGGLCFRRMTVPDDSEVSEELLSLSWRWPLLDDTRGTPDREDCDLSSGIVSPLCNLASTNLSVTCRLRGAPFRLLPLLPARLLFTLSFPSITFAGGGGCSIHLVSSMLAGVVLTTGGCKSLTGGFFAR
jgi:hypothetical protein